MCRLLIGCIRALTTTSILMLTLPSVQADAASQQTGLRVDGFASASVPATIVEVVFELPIDSPSFEESLAAAEAVRQRFVETLAKAAFDRIDVRLDPSNFRQKALSWRKGKKIEHRFAVKVEGLVPDRLLVTTARLMDLVLPIDPELTVTSLRSAAPRDALIAAHLKATAQAIHDAQERANLLAREAGMKLGPLQYLTPTQPSNHEPEIGRFEEVVILGRNFREPFSVLAKLETEFEVVASVQAIYAIAP